MSKGWKIVQLGTVLSKIIGGGTPSKSEPAYWDGDIPWCSVKDMSDNRFQIRHTQDKITKIGLINSSSNLIPKNTVVTATRMGLGRAFIAMEDMAINQDLKALIPNEKIDNNFLLWSLIAHRNVLENLGTGATVKGIRLEVLKALKISLPPLPAQKKIAGILFAYDELIENNIKRIELLEEQTQLIYEEWFVRMKFPSHENTRIDEEIGLPKGWSEEKIESLVEVTSSKRIFLSDYVEKGIPFFRGKEIILKSKNEPLNDRLYITQEKFNTIRKKFGVPTTGDVLITAVGTIGYPYLVTEDDGDFYFKDGNLIWLKNENKILSSYLISCFKNENFKARLNNISIGSSQKALTIKSLKALKILLPNESLLESFNEVIQPRFELISKLQVQNKYLNEARDILLPRLMMGIIEV